MKTFLVLGVAALLAACGGGSKSAKPGGASDDTPQWLSQGTGAFAGESGRKLQGVGSAGGAAQSRRKAADAAASQQLAGGIEAMAGLLSKASENTKENAADEIAGIARKAAAAAPHVRDHWVTPDGQETALDQIDLAAFKQALQTVDGDDALKREMFNNADRAFDQLVKQ